METQALAADSKTCQSLHVVGSQQPVDQLMMRTKESEANEIGVRLKIRLELGWHLFKVGGDGGQKEEPVSIFATQALTVCAVRQPAG